jgi:BirA family transcriptional regulator, biotin operon repressor / biotin---[acetyl-CoA-carboxylase] ligase
LEHPIPAIGSKVIVLGEVDSTNSYLSKKMLTEDLEEGIAVTAEFQTKGRGFGSNSWQSKKGENLLFSFMLRPAFLRPAHQFFFNQTVSLALLDLLKHYLPDAAIRIKWPNDILANGKKICGILIENSLMGNTFQYAITGIGINVNQTIVSIPGGTSMRILTNEIYDRAEILDHFFKKMQKRYSQLQQGEMDRLQRDYMENLFGVDERRKFKLKDKEVSGKIAGLSSAGKLIVEIDHKHEVFGFKEIEYVI